MRSLHHFDPGQTAGALHQVRAVHGVDVNVIDTLRGQPHDLYIEEAIEEIRQDVRTFAAVSDRLANVAEQLPEQITSERLAGARIVSRPGSGCRGTSRDRISETTAMPAAGAGARCRRHELMNHDSCLRR